MTKVFISYAHVDVEYSLYLYNALKSCGVDVWMDVFDIPPGTQNWDRIIHTALRECSHLVLIHKQNSFNSDETWSEWRQFLRYGKTVIPLIAENVELPFRLNSVQFVDFLNVPFEVAFEKLLDAILVRFPTPPDWDGSHKLLPLSRTNAESDTQTPVTEYDEEIFDRLSTEQRNRVHWAEEIRTKQLIQRKFIEQYSRIILNLDTDDTPPPRDYKNIYNFYSSGQSNAYSEYDFLNFNLSLHQRLLADLCNYSTVIKPFNSPKSWLDSNEFKFLNDKTYSLFNSCYPLANDPKSQQSHQESLTFSRDNHKCRTQSVFRQSFAIPIKARMNVN